MSHEFQVVADFKPINLDQHCSEITSFMLTEGSTNTLAGLQQLAITAKVAVLPIIAAKFIAIEPVKLTAKRAVITMQEPIVVKRVALGPELAADSQFPPTTVVVPASVRRRGFVFGRHRSSSFILQKIPIE